MRFNRVVAKLHKEYQTKSFSNKGRYRSRDSLARRSLDNNQKQQSAASQGATLIGSSKPDSNFNSSRVKGEKLVSFTVNDKRESL